MVEKSLIREKIIQGAPSCFNMLTAIFSDETIVRSKPKVLLYMICAQLDIKEEQVNIQNLWQWRRRYIAKLNRNSFVKKCEDGKNAPAAADEQNHWIDDFHPNKDEPPLIIPVYKK